MTLLFCNLCSFVQFIDIATYFISDCVTMILLVNLLIRLKTEVRLASFHDKDQYEHMFKEKLTSSILTQLYEFSCVVIQSVSEIPRQLTDKTIAALQKSLIL